MFFSKGILQPLFVDAESLCGPYCIGSRSPGTFRSHAGYDNFPHWPLEHRVLLTTASRVGLVPEYQFVQHKRG